MDIDIGEQYAHENEGDDGLDLDIAEVTELAEPEISIRNAVDLNPELKLSLPAAASAR